jgi:hypothetical protein
MEDKKIKDDGNRDSIGSVETVKEAGKGDLASSKAMLKEINQVNQEQKAVKFNDAEVPEYLWEEHLLEGIDKGVWE